MPVISGGQNGDPREACNLYPNQTVWEQLISRKYLVVHRGKHELIGRKMAILLLTNLNRNFYFLPYLSLQVCMISPTPGNAHLLECPETKREQLDLEKKLRAP